MTSNTLTEDQTSSDSSITFVCCVESGGLEVQTVRMIESLRRWGGKFANSPIVAVTSRIGPPITSATRHLFTRLDVKYIQLNEEYRYSWYPLLNKPRALIAAEKYSGTECIAWLDSDLLIVGEPNEFNLDKQTDFKACIPYKTPGGTTGPGDPLEYYWQTLCDSVDINIDSLPWVKTEVEEISLRLYWNSGVFVYRRSTDFGKYWLQTCVQILDARITSKEYRLGLHEQIALGLTAFKMGISWAPLPHSHNFGLGIRHLDNGYYKEDDPKSAKILHYHGAMNSQPNWTKFLNVLHETHPQVYSWLRLLGPIDEKIPKPPVLSRILLKPYFKITRGMRKRLYEKSCRVV